MATDNLVLTRKVEQYTNCYGSKWFDDKSNAIRKGIGCILIMFLMKQGQRFLTKWPTVPEVQEDQRKEIEGATLIHKLFIFDHQIIHKDTPI